MPATVKLSNGAVVTPTVDPGTIPNVDHTGHAQVVAMDHGKIPLPVNSRPPIMGGGRSLWMQGHRLTWC